MREKLEMIGALILFWVAGASVIFTIAWLQDTFLTGSPTSADRPHVTCEEDARGTVCYEE